MELKFSLLENIRPSKTQKSKEQQKHYERIVKELAGVYQRYARAAYGNDREELPLSMIVWAIKLSPNYLIARTTTGKPMIAGFLLFSPDKETGTIKIIERWGRPEFGGDEIVKQLEREMYHTAINAGFKRIGRIALSLKGRKEFGELVRQLKKEGEKVELKDSMMLLSPQRQPKKMKITRRHK